MFESEEKSPHRLLVPLPKTNNGSFDDMEDDKVGQGEAVGEQTKEDSDEEEDTDEAPGPLDPQLQREFARLVVCQNKLAHPQHM